MMRSRQPFRHVLLPAAMSLLAALLMSLAGTRPVLAAADDALVFAALQQAVAARKPDFGPQSGAITVPDNEPALSTAGIGSRDFAARLTCLLPTAPGDPPTDCGIAFRRNP